MSQCGREQRYEKQGNETDILRSRAGRGAGKFNRANIQTHAMTNVGDNS